MLIYPFLGRIAVLHKYQMQPVVTDGVVWSVCQSITIVSPAKTAKQIKMLLGVWTQVGRRNHTFDGGPDPPRETEILRGKLAAHFKVEVFFAMSLAKTPQVIKMPLWAQGSTC